MHDSEDNGGWTRRSPFRWQVDDGSRPSASRGTAGSRQKGRGVFIRRGGYGPGVAEGGLDCDAFGPRGGKGYSAARASGRVPQARRVRASV